VNIENKVLFTPTMASVLETQGYLQEAMEIYTYLLEQMPGHTVFREKIATIERRLAEDSLAGKKLSAVFGEWLALALDHRRLKVLKTLQSERRRQVNETDE
jgi:hypothetical protein